MAITDPRAIAFSNNEVRRFADLLSTTYYTALSMLNQWNSQDLAAIIPNTSAILADSAAPDGTDATDGDGRPIVTGAQVTNMINRAQDVVNWMQGSSTISAGSGGAVLTSVLGVKVNGQALF